MTLRGAGLGALVVLALGACKRAEPTAPVADADAPAKVAAVDAGVTAPRCTSGGAGASLAELAERRGLAIGDAVATAHGAAVGVVRSAQGELRSEIVQVSADVTHAEELPVARGAVVMADAPPPKPVPRGDDMFAAYMARPAARTGEAGRAERVIVLARVGASSVTPVATYREAADESFAFDAAASSDGSRAAVAWDESIGDKAAIRVGVASLGSAAAPAGKAGDAGEAARTVSGEGSDLDGPRVVARPGGGWWVAWTAHRPDLTGDPAPDASRAEVPGEVRAFAWIELTALDADGAPVAPARRLTSATGHAASFDLATRASGELDLFVRDETQDRDGNGGRIVHVVARAAGRDLAVDDLVTIVPAGVGRGSIDVIAAPGEAWLVFSDATDRTMLLPLGDARAPLAPPSPEEALEDARVLVASAGPGRIAAAFPAGEGALFRDVACVR